MPCFLHGRFKQRTTVADDGDAKVFQVLGRQVREDLLCYLVLAEYRLILPEAKAPEPNPDVHDDAPAISGYTHIMVCLDERVQDAPGWA